MRGAAILLALAVALGAALSATSQAQVAGLPSAYGGGSLPVDRPRPGREGADAMAVALVPAGDALRVRVSIGLRCTNVPGGISSDDLLLRVALAADGTFAGVKRVRSVDLGSARVKITGIATPDRAIGMVDVRSLRGRQRCRSGERPFVAKPVDPGAPLEPGGPPVPGALLVGLSSEKSSIPFGVVARIGDDGTFIADLFSTEIARCRGEGRRARRGRYSLDFQRSRSGGLLTNGMFTRVFRQTETPAERRRGIDFSFVDRFSVVITDRGLRATYESADRYREPGIISRCTIKPTTLRAVAAA